MASSVNELRGKHIFAGLSGGVDSSVAAALLRDAGAQVTGVFIKGWYPEGMPCTWREDRVDAMRAAAHLGIPFRTLDASTEYKRSVIDYLLSEYRMGRTPNPDIMCNRDVKFGAFLNYANKEGADFIATGHYASVERERGVARLLRGTDDAKDQSYFLWAVPLPALEQTLFPLGRMRKDAVRSLARRLGLPQAEKPDSQGICFLGDISVEDFLRKEFGEESGEAQDMVGNRVGTHDGVLLHTIGSRISLKGASAGPWYVVAKDIARNVVVVSTERGVSTRRAGISLTDLNIMDGIDPAETIVAQYRYHGPRIEGTFETATGTFTPLANVLEPLAPGQSLVLYRKEQLIGGGIMA